ncbi:hypothetical protein AB0I51_23050 [Streptomyces sp. NPDC050549]|uniref:hypothetical protein n=1 Tax=Streptomyces sp. NPDC050549 TaxID=3155406 RepID=UPI003411FD9A
MRKTSGPRSGDVWYLVRKQMLKRGAHRGPQRHPACPADSQAYRDAQADSSGATGVDCQLVDTAHVKLTDGILAQHVAVTNSHTP